MNMKNITKSGLNDFIGRKVFAQIKETNEQITAMIEAKINPIIASYVDVKKVEDLAAKFAEQMQQAVDKYKGILDNWRYSEVVSNVNYRAVSLGQKITEEIKTKIKDHIENPVKKAVKFEHEELTAATIQLQNDTKPLYDKLSNLKKLQTELEQVIKNEHNGGRAYKALVALGVDLDGYEEVSENLPAVVKLSVDVCLMNGNCDEKSA